MGECAICGTTNPDGGLKLTEQFELVCRWLLPCANALARRLQAESPAHERR